MSSTRPDEPGAPATDRRWQIFLIALSLFTLLLSPINMWQKAVISAYVPRSISAKTTGTGVPFVLRVTDSPPGSQLKNGDVLDLRLLSPEGRYRFENQIWVAGERIRIPVVRGVRTMVITVRAVGTGGLRFALTPHAIAFWLAQIALVLIPLFTMVVSLKRPGSAEIRILALLLLCRTISVPAGSNNWLTPWLWLDVTMHSLGNAAYALFIILIALYASMFGRPLSSLRRLLSVTTIVFAVASGALSEAATLFALGTAIDPFQFPTPVWYLAVDLPTSGALLAIIVAAQSAKGAERTRAIWATASITPLLGVDLVLAILSPLFSISDEVQLIAANTSLFVVLFGLSYALFNRRLLDVGFALNRATVFAALSLLVFGAFNFAEWALGGWLSTLNRSTNAALSAALALGLGLSLKPLHDAVERVVDRVFFRKRNEAERALRAFAHEAAFYTDARTLIDAAKSTIAKHAETARTALILERDAEFARLDPDDAALVALRAWLKHLDLHTVRSSLEGEFAFPLIVRGKLTGVLTIGPKRSAEPYAPDELDAIDRVALSVGIALDGLERAPDAENGKYLALITSAEGTMSALVDQIQALASAVDALASRTPATSGVAGLGTTPTSITAPQG